MVVSKMHRLQSGGCKTYE